MPGRPAPVHDEFQSFYKQHVGLVLFILKGFRLRAEEETELTQDVFLKVFQSWERIDSTSVKGLLGVTTRNLAIDHVRRSQVRKTELLPHEELPEGSLWEDDPQRLAERAIALGFIEEVAQTPGAECFGLFYKDGLTVKEIGEKLGESTGTITSKLTRLRRKFKELLRESLDG